MTTYTLITLPHGFGFDRLTRALARENCRAFIDGIPDRIQMLFAIVNNDGEPWSADRSEGSLQRLGVWFLSRVKERPLSAVERSAFLREVGPRWAFLADVSHPLTDETVSVGIDIAIYLGECIRQRCPGIAWELSAARQHRNRPVLAGFASREVYDPFDVANLVARRLLHARGHARSHSENPRSIGEQIAARMAALPPMNAADVLPEELRAWLRAYR
jgi:hypothetical protein